ncbi:hypothetical protein DSO57_1016041 [Entomophthora muscae]|uniref:Uncharacterized protein n=1 Tax=Entomophthora muscae TaxID=34485 RepID=A0ACC2UDV4_9FUNG|nr:hypothetical protein DSO57_1016041 [Entomophthora muscae]
MKDLMEKRHKMPENIWFDEYSKTHNKIRKEKRKEDARTRVNATYCFQCMMDTSSRKALDHLKVTRSRTAMTEVRRDNRSIATEEGEIKREVEDFYTSLYSPDTVDMHAAETLCNIAAPAIIKCGEEHKKDLVAQFTLKEVKATLKEAQREGTRSRQPPSGSIPPTAGSAGHQNGQPLQLVPDTRTSVPRRQQSEDLHDL